MKDQKDTIQGFCTKYALTQGIYPVEVERSFHDQSSPYVYCVERARTQLIIGKTFFEKEKDAVANARKQAESKIKAVTKQLKALEQLAKEPKWST